MSRVSNNALNLFLRTNYGDPAEKNTPAEAMRRLHLRGDAGKSYQDVVRLGSDDLELVSRQLDGEREQLQTDYTNAGEASAALTKIEELLTEADKLAENAEKMGLGQISRRANQKKLNAIIEQIEDTIANASATNKALFRGQTVLTAGIRTLKIDRVTLDDLGSVVTNGRSYNLADLKPNGLLDTARHPKRRTAVNAQASISAALAQIKKQRTGLENFQRDILRPRLGDVATSLAGIYSTRADTLTSTSDAMQTAIDIRNMMFTSATFAAAVGAEGWDRQRVLSLVSPTVAAALEAANSK